MTLNAIFRREFTVLFVGVDVVCVVFLGIVDDVVLAAVIVKLLLLLLFCCYS